MALDVFITFDGDCRAALEFYSQVFKQEMPQVMTYGENPEGFKDADRDRILYASLPLFGSTAMFSDCPSGFKSIKGNNIMLTIGLDDENEIKRIFDALAQGGQIQMNLGKTFFSGLFGMVTDQFGIPWQISKTPECGA
jgi:PhnB protein